ncbi:GIY-YIG nuclease family protein, partial [Actinotignum timonense]
VKIGMTRRLRPIERVQELSDASVPYNFDIHALFFSEDAVGVETELHHKFADRRVNLVNKRREFFAVTPAEVRDALKDIAGNLVEFTEEPEATQFRQTLAMRRAGGKDTDGLGGVAPESV